MGTFYPCLYLTYLVGLLPKSFFFVSSDHRSGHSTETALLSVTEALQIAKADSKSSILILLYLSAAFDTINHQILLSTLSSLGITGIPLRWFESFLPGRSFRVACGGKVHSKIPSVKLTLPGVYMCPHYRVLNVTLKRCQISTAGCLYM